MKSKSWTISFCVLILFILFIVSVLVIYVDPFFHYHKPYTSEFFYSLYNQRSQNNGITMHFDYDGLITGTSMVENFKTTELENIFDCSFIKVPYSGGTYKEINDNIKVALDNNPNLKIILRGLDIGKFIEDKDAMRYDLGEFPFYLYNNNPFDDVYYIFNRNVVFENALKMLLSKCKRNYKPGITSFDEYSNWMKNYTFGVHSKTMFNNGIPKTDRSIFQEEIKEDEVNLILENIRQNVTNVAKEYPNVSFIYFLTPYSAAWWQNMINTGTFNKQIKAERLVIEEILKIKNIKLFSFNNLFDLTTDLNNYKDITHYGEWINSFMLQCIKSGKYCLTKDNYNQYLKTEEEFYWNFDYEQCFKNQEDYEDDYYSAIMLIDKLTKIK